MAGAPWDVLGSASAKSIGHVGGGKTDRTSCVDVALIQSLYRRDEVTDFVAEYGQVIVDECHHISAFTFEHVMRQVKARYVVGLTREWAKPGAVRIQGTTWSNTSPVSKVEVSTDGGQNWKPAKLGGKATQYGWRLWQYDWKLAEGKYTLLSRAMNMAGERQPLVQHGTRTVTCGT
jgi:hypothetical protein